jgi:transposase
LTNRREDLVRVRTQTINRLHRLLVDLVPTGAGRNPTAARAAALLGQVSATGTPAITRWLLAADLIADGRDLDRRIAAVEARINSAVAQSTTGLVELFGVAPVLAARLLGEVGDIGRFPTKHHFAAHTGTAPLEPPSGQVVRHRLSRAGDRKLNHALYMMAIVQIRRPSAGQTYYRRKLAAGKSPKEALRCLRRRLSDAVYRCLIADEHRRSRQPPGWPAPAATGRPPAGMVGWGAAAIGPKLPHLSASAREASCSRSRRSMRGWDAIGSPTRSSDKGRPTWC